MSILFRNMEGNNRRTVRKLKVVPSRKPELEVERSEAGKPLFFITLFKKKKKTLNTYYFNKNKS